MTRTIVSMLLAALSAAVAAQPQGVPLMKPALPSTAAPASSFKTITWEVLVPPGWDPFKDFRATDLQALDDGDPRANALMKRMREAWDNAPTNPQIAGQAVRIPGFVVPLEDSKDGLREFLLVPYFGACIHSPPPPSNQIIHVVPKVPAKGLRSMDAVWVSGVIAPVNTDSYMGNSSWRIEAQTVATYVEPKTPPPAGEQRK